MHRGGPASPDRPHRDAPPHARRDRPPRRRRLDLDAGTLRVVEALPEVNGRVALGSTKTGAHRTVSLPHFLVDMLAGHLDAYTSMGGYVFTSAEGTPLRRNFYRRHFKPAVNRAGLPPALRFHDLRHTCAALLIAQGAHPKEIQERMGHSIIRLTFDRYGHLFPSLDSRLRDGLERAFPDAAASAPHGAHPPDAGTPGDRHPPLAP